MSACHAEADIRLLLDLTAASDLKQATDKPALRQGSAVWTWSNWLEKPVTTC
jgi:hypothetical protein